MTITANRHSEAVQGDLGESLFVSRTDMRKQVCMQMGLPVPVSVPGRRDKATFLQQLNMFMPVVQPPEIMGARAPRFSPRYCRALVLFIVDGMKVDDLRHTLREGVPAAQLEQFAGSTMAESIVGGDQRLLCAAIGNTALGFAEEYGLSVAARVPVRGVASIIGLTSEVLQASITRCIEFERRADVEDGVGQQLRYEPATAGSKAFPATMDTLAAMTVFSVDYPVQ